MRSMLSTAIVALALGTIAGGTVSVLAGSGAATVPQAVSDINADRVDGRHAVGAGASRSVRAGKLVATDQQGYLPKDIIKGMVTGITVTTVLSEQFMIDPNNGAGGATAVCPAGAVVGGGFSTQGNDVQVAISRPTDARSWWAYGRNAGSQARSIQAYAICMTTQPGGSITTVPPAS